MNFEDEHYCRVYTKDSKTWLRWGWEGQAVFMFTNRKLDKAGILDDVDAEAAAEDVALMTGLPIEVVEVGLPRVLKSGTFELRGNKLVCPNYIEANTAKKSSALRSKEYRERKRDEARAGFPHCDTGHHDSEQETLVSDESSQNDADETRIVSPCDEAPQSITPESPKSSSRAVQEQRSKDADVDPRLPGKSDETAPQQQQRPGVEPEQLRTPIPASPLTADAVAAMAKGYGVTKETILSAIAECVTYWTLGAGSGTRRTKAGWARTVRTSVKTKNDRGELRASKTATQHDGVRLGFGEA